MFRTLIRYAQRFAWLTLLAAMAAGVASAQTQDKKATTANQPADLLVRCRPCQPAVKTKKDDAKLKGAKQSNDQAPSILKVIKP